MRNQTTNFVLDDVVQHFFNVAQLLRRFGIHSGEMLDRFGVDRVNRFLARMFLGYSYSFDQSILRVRFDCGFDICVHAVQLHFHFRLTGDLYETIDRINDLLDLIMAEHDRFQHVRLGHFVRFRFNHHDRIAGTRYDDVQIADHFLLLRRVYDKLAVDSSDDNASDGSAKRHVGDRQRCGGSDHRRDFRRAILIHAEHQVNDLNVIPEAFREQRTNRAVR